MSRIETSTRMTVSLDTNVLHYVGLFLDHAREQNMACDAGIPDVPSRIATLLAGLETQSSWSKTKSLRQGGQTLKWLICEDVEVQYSTLSEIEMVAARTRGQALLHAAKEGLPHRMWSRFPAREIRERVAPQQVADVQAGVRDLLMRLEATGVRIGHLADSHRMEVPVVALVLCGLVYMDPLDGLIYATSVVAQARYLFTTDEYLRNTVNDIFKGSDSRFAVIRTGLLKVIGNGGYDLGLPSAHMIAANGDVIPNPRQLRGARGV